VVTIASRPSNIEMDFMGRNIKPPEIKEATVIDHSRR
jgi:hypothetical protein